MNRSRALLHGALASGQAVEAPEAPDPRGRILSGLGAITRTLRAGFDRKAVLEHFLDLLHLETRLPCAVLARDPGQQHLAVCCERGLPSGASALLRVPLGVPGLEEEGLVLVGADPEGPDLAGWCARYGCAQAALAPLRARGQLSGALLILAEGPQPFGLRDLGLMAELCGQAALLLDNLELHQLDRAKQALVEKLLERVIYAQEEERKWMAAELHDTIAQSLVGMHTLVQTCQQILPFDPVRAGGLLEELRHLVTESLAEVRQILFNLRPALENYGHRFMQGAGIDLVMDLPSRNQSRLPPLLETTVFRITQEALSNIKKHSGARHARVSLDIGTADLRLTVSDDGRGLAWSEVSERFQSGESHGLQGMQERARLLGGSLRFSNDPSGGTILEVVIPLARPEPTRGLDSPVLAAELERLLREEFGGASRGREQTPDGRDS